MVRYFIIRAISILSLIGAAYFADYAIADTIFEGYYRIKLGDKHAGYAIQRYEFIAKSKQFKSTYFIQFNKLVDNSQESLVAVATDKFEPVSYQYTGKIGSKFKTIDAQFEKNMMNVKVSDGKNVSPTSKQIPEGAFLSTFLGYVMLQNGYQIDKKYSYKAIAEEDGELHSGTAFLKEEAQYKGMTVYRVLNSFKGSQFVSMVSKKGEVLFTSSPMQKVSTELVAQPSEATAGLKMPMKTLKILFGNAPTGRTNLYHADKTQAKTKAATMKSQGKTMTSPATSKGNTTKKGK